MFGMLVVTVIAYLIGAIPFSQILAKFFRGIDLRAIGSGNIGATNLARAAGFRIALLGFLLDFLKGFTPAFLVSHFYGLSEWVIIVGLASVAGHIWSPFLAMKGGKGVSTAFGFIMAFDWRIAIGALTVFGIVFTFSKIVSISSILSSLSLLPFTLILKKEWLIVGIIFPILILYTHRVNIVRLITGEERRFR